MMTLILGADPAIRVRVRNMNVVVAFSDFGYNGHARMCTYIRA